VTVVGVFGGSFNPPHVAHVLAVAWVLSTQEVDRVLVVPAFRHPFSKSLAPFEERVAMCEAAMGWLPRVEVSKVEEELGGESRTLRTLEHLAAIHPDYRMRLIIGADLVVESPKWFGFDEITKIAPPLVLGRAGVAVQGGPPVVLPAVSSTDVREKIARGMWAELEPLVPRKVLERIRARGLYDEARKA
jgi:nicotinate-nucleotide adenylyltransferase